MEFLDYQYTIIRDIKRDRLFICVNFHYPERIRKKERDKRFIPVSVCNSDFYNKKGQILSNFRNLPRIRI